MIFHWAAAIIDAALALGRAVRFVVGRPFRVRNLWRALPGDLLGLMVMRGCGISGPTREVVSGDVTAVLVEDPRIRRWFRAHLLPVRAQTLGRYVFSRDALPPEILAHECEHIRQWERFGPLYLALYFASSAAALFRGGRPYWDNRFEAAARARSERDRATIRDERPG